MWYGGKGLVNFEKVGDEYRCHLGDICDERNHKFKCVKIHALNIIGNIGEYIIDDKFNYNGKEYNLEEGINFDLRSLFDDWYFIVDNKRITIPFPDFKYFCNIYDEHVFDCDINPQYEGSKIELRFRLSKSCDGHLRFKLLIERQILSSL